MKKTNNSAMREDGTWSSSKDDKYDYVLRYIAESIDFRTKKVALTTRAIEAYKGFPSKDGYKNAIDTYARLFDNEDKDRADAIRTKCKQVKSRKNMIVMRSIDSMVAQAQGGVGQFECSPYDPTFEKTPELVDALDAAAMDFYNKNHIDAVLPQMIEFAGLSGASYAYLGYDLDRSLDNGRIDLQIIPDTEMLIDPIGNKRNNPRYIGHQTKMAWADLKKHLIKCSLTDEYCLKSINEVDTYLNEVEYWINKYNGNFTQIAPAISNDADHFGGLVNGEWMGENLPHHIDTFYKASAIAWRERNTKYVHHAADTPNPDDSLYHAEDVEVCYVYDLKNHIRFTVVNRKFIVEANKSYLQKDMEYSYFEVDPISKKAVDMVGKKKISIDHPYVELSYKKSLWETFSYSPIIHILDLFDDACALETMIYHTISIMTPITFTGNPKDIEKLGSIAGVSGEAIKGFIANSVTVLNKAVDLSPAMSELNRIEQSIMNILHGVDPSQQSQMIGDRATAAEAMQAASLVSQGLNSLLANIEKWASELATKMFKLTVIYEDDDFMYDLSIDGAQKALSLKDLAGNFGVHAVLKSRIKAEQMAQAANTLQWFVPLMGDGSPIVNKEAFAQTVVPTLAQGFTRKAIASWFLPTADQLKAQEAQRELMKEQAQALAASRKLKSIDLGYVDPTSGGRYGAADISRALAGSPEQDYKMEKTDGRSKPTNTSRALNYGINNAPLDKNSSESMGPTDLPQSSIPSDYMAVPLENPIAGDMDELLSQDETASQSTLSALLNPTSGGYNENYNIGQAGNLM